MELEEFLKANKIKGAIFDMDGTLTDSMVRWSEIYAVLSGYLDIEFPREFMMKVNHIPMRERVKEIKDEFSLDFDVDGVYTYWLDKTKKYYENVFKIKPYMLETLKVLSSYGVKCGIATASDSRLAEAFIESNGLEKYMSSVTGLGEVTRPKSFPDVYLKAAEKLGVQPYECIVFEDALTAVKAAKKGGFYVCGVQDNCSANDEENIKSISDFTMGF